MFLTSKCTILFLLAWFGSIALAQKGTCPLQRTWGRFKADCDFRGSFTNPAIYNTATRAQSVYECASFCFYEKNDKCKLFHWDDTTGKCKLYSKYKDEMGYQVTPEDNGSFYEKLCYSTSCNVINSCNSFSACEYVFATRDYYYSYAEFGCSYGVDMQFPAHAHVNVTKQVFIPKAETACDAIHKCKTHAPYGSFVVAYFLPKKQWLCTLYDNACRLDYDCKDNYNTYDTTLENEYITRKTFMHKNASIGATVAYWQYFQYA